MVLERDALMSKPSSIDLSQAAVENQRKYEAIVRRELEPVLVHPLLDEGFDFFCDVNECACKTYGYTREEFLKLKAFDITEQEDVKQHARHDVRKSLQEHGHRIFETHHIKKNGERFPVEIDSLIIEHEGRQLIVAVIRDISAKQEVLESLQESEERFRTVFDQATDMVVVLDEAGHLLEANHESARFTGYSHEELLQMRVYDISPNAAEEDDASIWRSLGENETKTLQRSLLRKDGHRMSIEVKLGVIFLKGQKLILAFCRDTTQRMRNEQLIRESEERFRTMFKQATDAIYVWGMDGHLLMCNRQAHEFLGYSEDELRGIHISEVDPDFELENDYDTFWEELSDNESRTLDRSLVRKDGSRIPVEVKTCAMMLRGRKVNVGFCRDNSYRFEQERRLRDSEKRFREVLETVSSLCVQGYYSDGTVFFWNDANEKVYGYSKEEALGRHLLDLIFPEGMKSMVKELIKRGGETGEMPPADELCLKHKDGSDVWVYSSHVAVEVGGRYELYCLDVDLGKIKEAEAARENALKELTQAKNAAEAANQAKDDFLAVMSHEMRTPLNPIIGYTSLMLDDCSPDHQEMLQSVLYAGGRLLTLIEQILGYAKLEHGGLELKAEPCNLVSICSTAMEDISRDSHDLELTLQNGSEELDEVPEDMEILVDRDILLRVLDNLLTNACKYTKEGFVRLCVGMKHSHTEDDHFVFSVEDSGIGIEADQLEHLFEPFRQAEHSMSRHYDGVGLGLAVCRKLIVLLNGQLKAESKPGIGSRFWFEIPLKEVASRRMTPERLTAEYPVFEKKYRVLLVEDKDDNAALAQRLLNLAGLHCKRAENGIQAVELAAREAFDLILMDLSMPEMDGFEASRRIREEGGANAKTPILALSAHVSEEIKQQCRKVGMNGHINKPIERGQLLAMMKAQLVGD